jgi:ABC-2 type transport system ATP-binding protein
VAALLAGVGDGEPTTDGDVVRVPASGGTRVLAEVVRRLDERQVAARGLQLREPSLDDVFLSLTGRPPEDTHPGDAEAGER